jgi:hypothetical protein
MLEDIDFVSVFICGHQFHQYQENEQSPLILAELTEHKTNTTTYDVGNPDHGLGQACNGVE